MKEDRLEENVVDEEQESGEEDKQWTRRTQQIQGVIRNKLKNHDYATFIVSFFK